MEEKSISMSESTDKSGNKNVSYEKSWEDNGLRYRKEVRQVEGGYIVVESKYGKPKDEGEDADYIDERKEYVTDKNPLEKKKEEDDENTMFDFVDIPTF